MGHTLSKCCNSETEEEITSSNTNRENTANTVNLATPLAPKSLTRYELLHEQKTLISYLDKYKCTKIASIAGYRGFIHLEHLEKERNILDGWKVHISLATKPKENLISGYELVDEILCRHQAKHWKVVNEENIEKLDTGDIVGKFITVYIRDGKISEESWLNIFQEIENSLIANNIQPGSHPCIRSEKAHKQGAIDGTPETKVLHGDFVFCVNEGNTSEPYPFPDPTLTNTISISDDNAAPHSTSKQILDNAGAPLPKQSNQTIVADNSLTRKNNATINQRSKSLNDLTTPQHKHQHDDDKKHERKRHGSFS